MANETVFDVVTPLGFRVRATSSYWDVIVNINHPVMRGREKDLEEVLRYPDEIRRSRIDPDVYLFYRLERIGRWICAVVRQLDDDGFIITAYPTDTVKEGETVWTR